MYKNSSFASSCERLEAEYWEDKNRSEHFDCKRYCKHCCLWGYSLGDEDGELLHPVSLLNCLSLEGTEPGWLRFVRQDFETTPRESHEFYIPNCFQSSSRKRNALQIDWSRSKWRYDSAVLRVQSRKRRCVHTGVQDVRVMGCFRLQK